MSVGHVKKMLFSSLSCYHEDIFRHCNCHNLLSLKHNVTLLAYQVFINAKAKGECSKIPISLNKFSFMRTKFYETMQLFLEFVELFQFCSMGNTCVFMKSEIGCNSGFWVVAFLQYIAVEMVYWVWGMNNSAILQEKVGAYFKSGGGLCSISNAGIVHCARLLAFASRTRCV